LYDPSLLADSLLEEFFLATTIADGVWWLHGTRGCNVFLVRARDGSFAIIDTGFGDNVEPVADEVRRIAGDGPVTAIFLTHLHFDHSGAAQGLAEQFDAEVRAGIQDCEQVDGEWEVIAHRFKYKQRIRRKQINVDPPHTKVRPIECQEEVLPGVLAVPTPGHTAGSICYVVEDAGVALVGDMVISHSDGLSRTLVAANSDDETYLSSIRSFSERTPDIGCAGHGLPVLEGFQAQLQRLSEKPRQRIKPWEYPRRMKRMFDFYRFMNRRRKP
jgi:glyoxylase-like metal-dependent hydrolase (beta-lactamase superfamily II)